MKFSIGMQVGFFGMCLAATPVVADFKRVTKEADFLQIIAGKSLVDTNGGRYVIKADGTMSGTAPSGEKLRGAWQWSGKNWCRNIVVGSRELGTKCQRWEVDGNSYRVTRDKGRGDSVTGTIN